MTADDSSDPGRQRTVAELLEQYGGATGGSRRRRRAPKDVPGKPHGAGDDDASDDFAADDYAVREYGSEDYADRLYGAHRSAGYGGADPGPAGPTYPAAGPPPAVPTPAVPPPVVPMPAVPEQRWVGGTGYGQSIDPLTGEPIGPVPDRPGTPPAGAASATGYRRVPADRADPPTEQLPRYPEQDPPAGPMTGPMTGPLTGPLSWSRNAGATPSTERPGDFDDDDGPATGEVARADRFPGRKSGDEDEEERNRSALAAPAGLAERADRGEFSDHDLDDEDDRPVGVKAWAGLIAQWVLGAVAGGLLWVGFYYLWTHYAVIALVTAVVATAGLVFLVRAIRRSDDLQTTMLAVLVGLVVTISPAVLLLAAR